MNAQDEDDLAKANATWKRIKTAAIQRDIDAYHSLYASTGNPFHALTAYRLVRSFKIDVPTWILEVFDKWAEVLVKQPPKGAQEIAVALGLVGTGGGPSIASRAKTQARNLRIARRVFVLRKSDPEREMLDVFLQVAEQFGLSSERVQGIWYELMPGTKL